MGGGTKTGKTGPRLFILGFLAKYSNLPSGNEFKTTLAVYPLHACMHMCPSIGFTFPRHGRINTRHNVNEILNYINVSVPEMVRILFHR